MGGLGQAHRVSEGEEESACVWLAFVEKAFVRTGVVEVWEWLRFVIL